MPKRNPYAWVTRLRKTSDVPKPKGRLGTFQNAVTFTLSVSAFLLSAVSTYFSVIRVEDELFLIARRSPQISEDRSNPEEYGKEEFFGVRVDKDSPINFIFMNSGTRPIAVTDVKILLYLFDDFDWKNGDCFSQKDAFTTTFTPIVVRAGETVISTFSLKTAPREYALEGNGFVRRFGADDWLRAHPGEKWTSLHRVTCAEIEMAGFQYQWSKNVLIDWSVSGKEALEKVAPGGDWRQMIELTNRFLRPQSIYRNVRTIFW